MKYRALLLTCFSLAFTAAHPQTPQEEPALIGYVTRAVSNTDFDVNGFRVQCTARTTSVAKSQTGPEMSNDGCPETAPYVGEPIWVYGSIKRKQSAVIAQRIETHLEPSSDVSGQAVIDALPPRRGTGASTAQPETLLVRADGYRILLTATTNIIWSAQRNSLAQVRPGDWIQYRGRLDAFGLLVAADARIAPDSVSLREENLRNKSEYDPAAVPASTKQNETVRVLFGKYNPKKFPPHKDPAMQARVEVIGNKLIPAYQRALPDTDPAKIHFRFQVVDANQLNDAWALPSGIILVPSKVVGRLENDAQLAAVLASSIAGALEKQQYRDQRARRAAEIGSFDNLTPAAFLALPTVGAATWIAGKETLRHLAASELAQSSRESLALLHDAGYDIDEAPLAWWLLTRSRPLAQTNLPARPEYMYRILGEEWRNPALARSSGSTSEAAN